MRSPMVLIVDDNDLVRDMSEAVLRQQGYHPLVANSAGAALDVLAAQPGIGVVVTDLTMPGDMDGSGLVAHLRETRPDVGVVITTGLMPDAHSFDDTVVVLLKPFGIDDLVGAVERVRPRS